MILNNTLSEKTEILLSDHQFSDYIHLLNLAEKPDDQGVLRYAYGREQAVMVQYAALVVNIPSGPIADLFQFLVNNQEMEHKKERKKIYYEADHSGGV